MKITLQEVEQALADLLEFDEEQSFTLNGLKRAVQLFEEQEKDNENNAS